MGILSQKLQQAITFLREVRAEMNRVTWPTREAVIGGTVAVIVLSLILVIYMGIIDFIVTKLLGLLVVR